MLIRKMILGSALYFSLLALSVASDSNITLNYGLYHGTGYFEHDYNSTVTSLFFSSAYKLSSSDEIKLTLSYIDISHARTSNQPSNNSIGDTVLSYKRRAQLNNKQRILDIETKIKIPTANDAKGLGTGEMDYTLTCSYYQYISRTWLFIKLGHKWRGDSVTRSMDNGYLAKLGASLALSSQYNIGSDLGYYEASSPRAEERKEAMFYLSYKITKKLKSTFYTVRGLSDSSPQWAGGVQFSQHFD